MKIFAFDSFAGLPHDPRDLRDPIWVKGAYSATLDEVRENAKRNKVSGIEYIKGFYKDTLTAALAEEMKATPPSIVYIDVDLYSSAIAVLNWLDKIALPGAIYIFDDVWANGNHPDTGESKAIIEYHLVKSSRGFLTEDPISLGSKTVYRFCLRDPEENAHFAAYH